MSESLLNIAQIRELEEKYARILGTYELMKRAGIAAAEYIAKKAQPGLRVTILCGRGNNGGDGYVCALYLKEMGYDVTVVQVGARAPKSPEAQRALKAWENANGKLFFDPYQTEKADVVVDAIFGIGLSRALEGDELDAAMWFNERQALHVSLDIPSGLDSQTGTWVGGRLGCRADHTITFLAGKPGLFTADGLDACGHVHIDNLGISIPLTTSNLIEPVDFVHVLQPRKHNTAKHNYGKVGVIGGGSGTVGAALIAARSALFMGAGRVYVELLEDNMRLDPFCPELMFRDRIDPKEMDAVVIGPGLGFSELARRRVYECTEISGALILDADALTMIAKDEELLSKIAHRMGPTVITPHPGEAASLLGLSTKEIQADRLSRALDLSVLTGAVSVLKGAGTIVTQRSSLSWINPTGTSALATAGSGDALTGMIAAMFAQHYELITSVISAVYLHGAASEGRDFGLLASELAPRAAEVLRKLRASVTANGIQRASTLSEHSRVATHHIY